jgi:hypothetical protein
MTIASDDTPGRRTRWSGLTGNRGPETEDPTATLRIINTDSSDYLQLLENRLDFPSEIMYHDISSSNNTRYNFGIRTMSEDLYSISSSGKMVPLDSVIRGAGLIVGSVSVMSLLATILSGAIIIQPLFAVALLISCVGFYLMTFR